MLIASTAAAQAVDPVRPLSRSDTDRERRNVASVRHRSSAGRQDRDAPVSPRRTRQRLAVLTGLVLLTLTGCSSDDLPTFAMPERDATDQAPRILSLWQGSWVAALAVGVVSGA